MSNVSLAIIIAVVPVAAAALLGNIATMPNIPTWYAGLAKPFFNPPNWIFGPIWAVLYVMMAYAFYRVLTSTEGRWTIDGGSAVSDPDRSQRSMVVGFLCRPQSARWAIDDPSVVGGDSTDGVQLLANRPNGKRLAVAVSRLGRIRGSPELGDHAA